MVHASEKGINLLTQVEKNIHQLSIFFAQKIAQILGKMSVFCFIKENGAKQVKNCHGLGVCVPKTVSFPGNNMRDLENL